MNAYEILECTDRNISQNDLKQHYQKLLLKYHPDKCVSNETNHESLEVINDRFIKIQTAYKLLSDLDQRTKYDSILKQIELERETGLSASCCDNALSYYTLQNDFELNESAKAYTRNCRCGSYFKIGQAELNEFLIAYQNETIEYSFELLVNLQCDTCSLSINVLFI